MMFKMTMLAVLFAATSAMADVLPIDSKFTTSDKGALVKWRLNRTGAALEVLEASDKKGNAVFIEPETNSVGLSHPMIDISKYKELAFSVRARGNGGFAVQLGLYNEKGRYVTTKVFLENRGGSEFKVFNGKLEIPEKINDQTIRYCTVVLLTFRNSQLLYENPVLEGTLR